MQLFIIINWLLLVMLTMINPGNRNYVIDLLDI